MHQIRLPRMLLLAVGMAGALLVTSTRVSADDDPLVKKALAYNDVTGDDPIRAEIKSLVDDPAATKKLLAAILPIAKKKDQPFNYNGAFILGRASFALRDLSASEVFHRICVDQATKLQSARKMAQAYEGLLEILFLNKKYEECVKLCREFLEIPTDEGKIEVLEVMIQALAKQGKIDEATKLVNNLVTRVPNNWLFLDLKSQVLFEAGKFDEAAKTYEEVLGLVAKDENLPGESKTKLTERYRYLLSSSYIEAQNIDKAAEWLRKLVADNPDNPTYNNDLGYVLADHNRDLDEAERLIRKALDEDRKLRKKKPGYDEKEDKDVAAYLDSLGWVLFRKKNYTDAKKYLQQAVKDKEGQHVEIYDHLGDVQMALGEKAAAISTWKKALETEPISKRDTARKAAIEKKLKALDESKKP